MRSIGKLNTPSDKKQSTSVLSEDVWKHMTGEGPRVIKVPELIIFIIL